MLFYQVPYIKPCAQMSEAGTSAGIKTVSSEESGEAGTLRKGSCVNRMAEATS